MKKRMMALLLTVCFVLCSFAVPALAADSPTKAVTFVLEDEYGDGWNGNTLTVGYKDADGEDQSEYVTFEEGSSAEFMLEILNPSEVTLSWTEGNWSYECSFDIVLDGTVIYSGEAWNNEPKTVRIEDFYVVTLHDPLSDKTLDTIVYASDGSVDLSDYPFYHPGYSVEGWATTKGGEVVYAAGAVAENIESNLDLYGVLAEIDGIAYTGQDNNGQGATYLISTADQLRLLSEMVAEGVSYHNALFKQTKDIDLGAKWDADGLTSGEAFTPIGGDGEYLFKGVYDGQDFAISGLYIDGVRESEYGTWNAGRQGLFGEMAIGGVRNLTLNGKIVNVGEDVGAFAGILSMGGFIENCVSNVDIASDDGNDVGGIVGDIYRSTVTRCVNNGSIAISNSSQNDEPEIYDIGGIAGYAERTTITDCVNNGTITVGDSSWEIGGIVGEAGNSTITDCVNNAAVTLKEYVENVGGVAGHVWDSAVTGCGNNAAITLESHSDDIGGVVGDAEDSTVAGCANSGNIVLSAGGSDVGGIAGDVDDSEISGCFNTGNISGNIPTDAQLEEIFEIIRCLIESEGEYYVDDEEADLFNSMSDCIGGIAGDFDNSTMLRSGNTGNLRGMMMVGGLAGSARESVVSNSYNAGNLTAIAYAGGFFGVADGIKLLNSYNTGTFTPGGAKTFAIGGMVGYFEESESAFVNIYSSDASAGIHGAVFGLSMKNTQDREETQPIQIETLNVLGIWKDAVLFENVFYNSAVADIFGSFDEDLQKEFFSLFGFRGDLTELGATPEGIVALSEAQMKAADFVDTLNGYTPSDDFDALELTESQAAFLTWYQDMDGANRGFPRFEESENPITGARLALGLACLTMVGAAVLIAAAVRRKKKATR